MTHYIPSRSQLERYIDNRLNQFFSKHTIRVHYRPEWMLEITGRRLELDFYIEEIRIAIEVQGTQHYEYVPIMHGNYDGYVDQRKRDLLKSYACQVKTIRLYTVFDIPSADAVIKELVLHFIPPVPEHFEELLGGRDFIHLGSTADSFTPPDIDDDYRIAAFGSALSFDKPQVSDHSSSEPSVLPTCERHLTRRTVAEIAKQLNADGSFTVWTGKRWKATTNAVAIAEQFQRMGFGHVMPRHVIDAQVIARRLLA